MLRIGPIALSTPVVQAALSGYSDRPMRMVARRYGCEYAINEVVVDELVLVKGKFRKRFLSVGDDDHPVGGQLMGSEPVHFAEAANDMVEGGYDVIDINFGCPVRNAVGRCRGGYLLTDPVTALEIVKAVIGAVAGRCPVTLKMRRAYDDTAGSERDFYTILDGAFALGVMAVTVHGRTVKQKYVGPAKWDALARVKRHVGDRTILGSGDLFTANAAKRMLEETGIDGASIARGAIGNPFIFRECREIFAGRPLPLPPTVVEQRDALLLHQELSLVEVGADRVSRMMRHFGIKYAELHPMRDEVKRAWIAVTDNASAARVLEEWYDPSRAWPEPVRRESPIDLVAAGATLV